MSTPDPVETARFLARQQKARLEGARPDTDGWDETSRDLAAALEAHGWTVRLVDYCEDARTPGLLGAIRGVTDRDRREVKVGRKASPTPAERAAILAHEVRHVLDPAWDCGNRDVFGRGGPQDDSPPPPLGWHEHGEPPAGMHEHGGYPRHAHIDFEAPGAPVTSPAFAVAAAAAIVNDPVAMRAVARKLESARWACEDCGWEWPMAGPPPPGAECDSCGGYLLPGEGTP